MAAGGFVNSRGLATKPPAKMARVESSAEVGSDLEKKLAARYTDSVL